MSERSYDYNERKFIPFPASDQPKRCRKCLTDFDLATGLNVSEKDGTLCVDCGDKEHAHNDV